MLKNFFPREHWWYAAVLAIAVFLIFFRLDRADMQTDGAVYSLRALGYLDYLNADVQTTPLQWFDRLPWWSKLSFHDAPPLVLLIQFAFFSLFGHTTFVARLPGALAGVGTVILVMAIARRLWGQRSAVVAGLLLASSTLFTWAAREPYLEGIETFFIILCLWCFVLALERPAWYFAWGASLGAALLSKYTAVLVAFGTLMYLLISRRTVFRDRRFWLGLAVAALLVSPLAVYNGNLYRTRGHLDLQLSKLAPGTWGAARTSWPKLYQNIGKPKPYADYALGTVRDFRASASAPWFWLALAVMGWWTWRLVANRADRKNPVTAVWLCVVALVAFFFVNGSAPRFMPPAMPLFALLAAASWARIPRRYLAICALMVVAAVSLAEGTVNINTNLTVHPRGPSWLYRPALRLGNDGYQQLARYLDPLLRQQPGYGFRPVRSSADLISDIEAVAGQDVFLYPNDLRWFSTFWYFQQYSIYHRVYFIGDRDLAALARQRGEEIRVVNFFRERGVRRLHFIAGANPRVYEAGVDVAQAGQRTDIERAFADNLDRGAPGGLTEIKNPAGEPAFRVYTLDLAASQAAGR